ncbi:MAG: PEP-CTERM sorting domain-containing protein [Planctomycetota bacterium]
MVEGSVSIMAGQEVGTSSYAGVGYTTFQPNTRFQELTRFGNAAAGGLVVYDFDLSAYLAGKTIGSNNGDSAFSLDVNWDEQRNEPPENAGLWFISYNDAGAGLTLDTTDITTFAVGGNSSGVANYNLVTDATKYKPVLTLGDPGSESIDLSSDFAAIQAGDGVIRVAYLERAFRGDIRLLAGSGLVETIVPEPSTAALATVGLLSVLVRRRRRSC